jgi:hypothetical protein
MGKVAFIVEGHGEYDTFLSFASKILGQIYFPISNAMGIGNIMKNTGDELLKVIKLCKPEKVIITLDYREALRENLVKDCIELKEKIYENCNQFIESQKNGSLQMPAEIIVIIADKTYESWLCADYEGLKDNKLINSGLITETFQNVDEEIPSPNSWLNSKLKKGVNLKKKAHRKLIASTLRPEIASQNSRSFRKFYKEIMRINVA